MARKAKVVENTENKAKLISFALPENIEGYFYPNKIKFVAEFDVKPELENLKIDIPPGFKMFGSIKKVDETHYEIIFDVPNANCKYNFVANYKDSEPITTEVQIFTEENCFEKIACDMKECQVGETFVVSLMFKNDITDKDIPYYENFKNVKKVGSYKKMKNRIEYKFKATEVGECSIIFGCYKGQSNQVAKELKISIIEKDNSKERVYALNEANFTAVGSTFLTLCNNTVIIPATDTNSIQEAEQQVILRVLKRIK